MNNNYASRNDYLYGVLAPQIHSKSGIPDEDMTLIHVKAVNSLNILSSSEEYVLVSCPRGFEYPVLVGKKVVSPITGTNVVGFTGYFTYDNLIDLDYDKVRIISFGVFCRSNTISTTNSTLSGRIRANYTSSLIPFSTWDPNTISSLNGGRMVPIRDLMTGVVFIHHPAMHEPWLPVKNSLDLSTSRRNSAPSAALVNVNAASGVVIGRWDKTTDPNYFPDYLMGRFLVQGQVGMSMLTTGSLNNLEIRAWYLDGTGTLVSSDFAINYFPDGSSIGDISIVSLECSLTTIYPLSRITVTCPTGSFGTYTVLGMRLSLIIPSLGNPSKFNDLGLFYLDACDTDQKIDLNFFANFETVPSYELSLSVNTDVVPYDYMAHTDAIVMLSQNKDLIPRIASLNDYLKVLETEDLFVVENLRVARAASFKDFARKYLKPLSKVAFTIGDAFEPLIAERFPQADKAYKAVRTIAQNTGYAAEDRSDQKTKPRYRGPRENVRRAYAGKSLVDQDLLDYETEVADGLLNQPLRPFESYKGALMFLLTHLDFDIDSIGVTGDLTGFGLDPVPDDMTGWYDKSSVCHIAHFIFQNKKLVVFTGVDNVFKILKTARAAREVGLPAYQQAYIDSIDNKEASVLFCYDGDLEVLNKFKAWIGEPLIYNDMYIELPRSLYHILCSNPNAKIARASSKYESDVLDQLASYADDLEEKENYYDPVEEETNETFLDNWDEYPAEHDEYDYIDEVKEEVVVRPTRNANRNVTTAVRAKPISKANRDSLPRSRVSYSMIAARGTYDSFEKDLVERLLPTRPVARMYFPVLTGEGDDTKGDVFGLCLTLHPLDGNADDATFARSYSPYVHSDKLTVMFETSLNKAEEVFNSTFGWLNYGPYFQVGRIYISVDCPGYDLIEDTSWTAAYCALLMPIASGAVLSGLQLGENGTFGAITEEARDVKLKAVIADPSYDMLFISGGEAWLDPRFDYTDHAIDIMDPMSLYVIDNLRQFQRKFWVSKLFDPRIFGDVVNSRKLVNFATAEWPKTQKGEAAASIPISLIFNENKFSQAYVLNQKDPSTWTVKDWEFALSVNRNPINIMNNMTSRGASRDEALAFFHEQIHKFVNGELKVIAKNEPDRAASEAAYSLNDVIKGKEYTLMDAIKGLKSTYALLTKTQTRESVLNMLPDPQKPILNGLINRKFALPSNGVPIKLGNSIASIRDKLDKESRGKRKVKTSRPTANLKSQQNDILSEIYR